MSISWCWICTVAITFVNVAISVIKVFAYNQQKWRRLSSFQINDYCTSPSYALLSYLLRYLFMFLLYTGRNETWKIFYEIPGPFHVEVESSVIISCNYTNMANWTPTLIRWHKCKETDIKRKWSEIIFHSDNGDDQAEFKGPVSLLETDLQYSKIQKCQHCN